MKRARSSFAAIFKRIQREHFSAQASIESPPKQHSSNSAKPPVKNHRKLDKQSPRKTSNDNTKRLLLAGLKSCSSSRDLSKGRKLHQEAIQSNLIDDLFVGTALVDMYSNCSSMPEARQIFDSMLHRDVVSWNALIAGYVDNGSSDEALRLFDTMQASADGCSPSSRTLVAVLTAYTSLATRNPSRHPELLEKGLGLYSGAGSRANNFVAAAMVDLCAKCGSLDRAERVFRSAPRPDVSLWNVYILGLVENGANDEAIRLLFSMIDPAPNARTVMAALLACGNLALQEESTRRDGSSLKVAALEIGLAVHDLARRIRCDDHNFVANCLIDMYSRCGSVVESRRVFDAMKNKTVVSWTAMIVGYELNGEDDLALELFARMRIDPQGCEPDERAAVAALTACSSSACKEAGQIVDGKIVKVESLRRGMEIHSKSRRVDIFVETALIDMYAKCGSLEDARRVFESMDRRDVAAWNVLIAGHAQGGEAERALDLFDRMQEQGTCSPNPTTLVAALTACVDLAARDEERSEFDEIRGEKSGFDETGRSSWLRRGMDLHRRAKELGCETDTSVAAALLELYARCGSLTEMLTVFDSMPSRNVSAWTAVILGHVQAGDGRTALEIFYRMEQDQDHCVPKVWTFACALKACSMLLDVPAGRSLHAAACRRGLDDSIQLETVFMDFYGRSGKASEAHRIFDARLARDSLSWNSLMSSYSLQGDAEMVFELFREMRREESVAVTAATFVCLLATCSHAGLVERGKKCFESMRSGHGLEPGLEHYNCLIDMLGRANKLDEAVGVAKSMPREANALTWRCLLAACQTWKNVEIGKVAFDELVKLDGKDPAGYVLMSNIYSSQSGS